MAAWNLSFLTVVISRVEQGKSLLCSTVEEQMTVFGAALFSAQFQYFIWAGVCELAVIVSSYELAEIEV